MEKIEQIINELKKETLKNYISDINGKNIIRHPFLIETLTHPLNEPFKNTIHSQIIKNEFFNKCETYEDFLLRKINSKKDEYNDYKNNNDFENMMWLIEKPFKLNWFYENQHIIKDDKIYYQVLKQCYQSIEFPSHSFNEGNKKILGLMNSRVYPHFMMDEVELKKYNELENEVTIYRGIWNYDGVDEDDLGISYTMNKEMGIWFGKRFDTQGTPYLIEGIVNKRDIITILLNRDEEEVIINPIHLKNIKITEIK